MYPLTLMYSWLVCQRVLAKQKSAVCGEQLLGKDGAKGKAKEPLVGGHYPGELRIH